MPRYVVHIGPHKTGSTYLQASFRGAESQFRDRGILHVRRWLAGGVAHELLCRRLKAMPDDALARDFAELNRSSHDIVLISAEDLADLKPDQVAYFKTLMADSPVQIVFYCRRWSEIILSGWKEMVKHGYMQTFPTICSMHLVNPYASHVMNYAITATKFSDVFGPEAIRLVSYNNLVDQNIDLFEHFARTFLDFPNPAPSTAGRPNTSISVFEAEAIRALNALEWARGGAGSANLYRKYTQNREVQARTAGELSRIVEAMQQDQLALQMNEDGASLRALHRSVFEKFGGRLVPPRSGDALFVPRNARISFVGQNYLLRDGVLDALRTIHDQLR
jgi:hypothetical protein